MTEAGFTYHAPDAPTPATNTPAPDTPSSATSTPAPDTRDYAATYGFGITTQAFSQDQVGDQLIGYNPVAGPETTENPNIAALTQLDDQEQAAYVHALTGKTIDTPIDHGALSEHLKGSTDAGGCQGEARAEYDNQTRFYTEFGDDLQALRQQVLADPRILEHQQQIRDCVTQQGLTYIEPQDLYQHWADELNTINDTITYPQTNNTNQGDTPTRPALSAEGRARLLTIQTQETQLALAVHDCGGDPQTTSQLYTEVAHDHEQQFIDQHQDRLDTYLDTTG